MRRLLLVLILVTLISLACNMGVSVKPDVALPTKPPKPPIPKNVPTLAISESAVATSAAPSILPGVDATDTVSPVVAGGNVAYTITNPSSGAALYVAVYFPNSWNGQSKLPALVLIPGGSGASGTFTKGTPKSPSTVSIMNEAGIIAVIFDPDGRGRSTGKEDYDGFIHQDGLAEVIRFTAGVQGVDVTKIGLTTFSFGITMGAGALARYPELPVSFLIDWEGPAHRDDTGGCDSAGLGHLKEIASCTDETFWAQREASTFIGQIRVPYQRIQSEKDHVQLDYAHTILMIDNAVQGGVPWVRLNNESPNQTYDLASMPRMLPESMDKQRDQLILKYAQELIR